MSAGEDNNSAGVKPCDIRSSLGREGPTMIESLGSDKTEYLG